MREDIRKRREKYKELTAAQKIFGGKEMITSRPEGMKFFHYRYMLTVQTRTLRKLFKRNPNPQLAAATRPTYPSLHLLKEVTKRKLIKEGQLEPVVPVESVFSNFMVRIFNYFRNIFSRPSYVTAI